MVDVCLTKIVVTILHKNLNSGCLQSETCQQVLDSPLVVDIKWGMSFQNSVESWLLDLISAFQLERNVSDFVSYLSDLF